MEVYKLGVGDKAVQKLDQTAKTSQLETKELLFNILTELKIMNIHNSEITGAMIKAEDIENDY